MYNIKHLESYIDNNTLHYGCFELEPLEPGQALTIANALRRTLLSELIGTAITSVRISNVKHEFSAMHGIREDVLDLLLNLKEVRFRTTKFCPTHLQLQICGPSIVTAGRITTPKHLQILNKSQYLATVHESAILEMEIKVEQGKGYIFANQETVTNNINNIEDQFLEIDAIFSPVKKVNYRIKLLPYDKQEIKESLIFEIWTDGSITPKRSLKEATKFLIKLLYPII